MDRIAARAGINKERLYNCFGGKQKLFAMVLSDELAKADAAHLLFLVLSLSLWWFAVPQVARMMTGSDPDNPAERARRRAATVAATRRLAYSRDSQGNPSQPRR